MALIGLPGAVNGTVNGSEATSLPRSQVMYSRPDAAGSVTSRTWNASGPRTLTGFESVLPPFVGSGNPGGAGNVAPPLQRHERQIQRSVGGERHIRHVALRLLALGRRNRGLGPALAPSEDTCNPQEKKGVSMRLEAARLDGRTGFRTSVGESCALMSWGSVAPTLIGASLPTTRASRERSEEHQSPELDEHE